MGRKEKETNPADVAVVAKRTYTRRNTINNDNVGLIKSNNMTSTTEQFNNATSSHTIAPNNTEFSIDKNAITNGIQLPKVYGRQKSNIPKCNSDEEDFMPDASTSKMIIPCIRNQRPKRQVKHKFIKSGNQLDDSDTSSLITDISTSTAELVPVVHRLSIHTSDWSNCFANDSHDDKIEIKNCKPNVAIESANDFTKEKSIGQKSKKSLGIPMRRSRRHLPCASEIDKSSSTDSYTLNEPNENDPLQSHTVHGNDDSSQEIIIEEIVTTDFDDKSYEMVYVENDNVESNEAINSIDTTEVIDLSDSLSFLGSDSEVETSQSTVAQPMDMDENSGSIILVSNEIADSNTLPDSNDITTSETMKSYPINDGNNCDSSSSDGEDETPLNRRIKKIYRKNGQLQSNCINSDTSTNHSDLNQLNKNLRIANSKCNTNNLDSSSSSDSETLANINKMHLVEIDASADTNALSPTKRNFEHLNSYVDLTKNNSMLFPSSSSHLEVNENDVLKSSEEIIVATPETIENNGESISQNQEINKFDSNDANSETDIITENSQTSDTDMTNSISLRPRRDSVARKNYLFQRSYGTRKSRKDQEVSPHEDVKSADDQQNESNDTEISIIDSTNVTAACNILVDTAKTEKADTFEISAIDNEDESMPELLFERAKAQRTYQKRRENNNHNLISNDAIELDSNITTSVDKDVIVHSPVTIQTECDESYVKTELEPTKTEVNLVENTIILETDNIVPTPVPKRRSVGRPRKSVTKAINEIKITTEINNQSAAPTECRLLDANETKNTIENSINVQQINTNVECCAALSGDLAKSVKMNDVKNDISDKHCNEEIKEIEPMDVCISTVSTDTKAEIEIKAEFGESVKDEPTADITDVTTEIFKGETKTEPLSCEISSPIQENNELKMDLSTSIKVEDPLIELKVAEEKLVSDKNAMNAIDNILSILPNDFAQESEDTKSIRRSGRIKTIKKSKQPSQGFGLVRDKKRIITNIGEDELSNPSMDADNIGNKDGLPTTFGGSVIPIKQKTKEELEKEQIDRENGLKLFAQIADNEYRSERVISKEAKKMSCDCFLTHSEMERGELGCGDDCLNRMLLIECGVRCIVGERCTNKRFQKHENANCTIFKTEKKGYGLVASAYIPAGVFIMEYVGEVLNSKQFEKRANEYSKQMNAHYYFMALSSDCVIDATKKGNISRFINHSCDPNAETQKWTVNGELRIGFFSSRPILPDEEITFDYQFQRYGKEAQRCYCEAENCRGWIGGEPDSEDEIDDEDDDDDSDEEERIENKEDIESIKLAQTDEILSAKETAQKKIKAAAKPKKPKDTAKKRTKKSQSKSLRKITMDFQKHMKRSEIMEDPDLDKEIDVLALSGLKNQVQTLQFSRLMVRAKLQKAKSRLLLILRKGELPCRRLFLDYHGLKLVHSWMSDISDAENLLCLTFRLDILQTLEVLPITNKTMLHDSKVLSTVQRWTKIVEYTNVNPIINKTPIATKDESGDSGSGTPISNDGVSSPKIEETAQVPLHAQSTTATLLPSTPPIPSVSTENAIKQANVLEAIPQLLEQSSALKGLGVDMLKRIISTNEQNVKIIEDSETMPDGERGKLIREIRLLAMKLVVTWEQLPESFKIPKKLRLEQMKEHEREADQNYKETVSDDLQKPPTTTYSNRYQERFRERDKAIEIDASREKDPRYRRYNTNLSKYQRRQMFEAKVAQENADRKKTADQITHEAKCSFFHLDPRKVAKPTMPFCVNPTTGQWYGEEMNPIPTPPSHAHIKPPPPVIPTIKEYKLPHIDLPDLWKYAVNENGQIYYYHAKILIPQWEPPIKLLPLMEEHRIADIDLKDESIDNICTEDDHDMDNDFDDEDEDIVNILSNSEMNSKRLLQLKSDPILEKYNDDDSSSTDSDDSIQNELETTLSFIKEKTDAYWENMKKLPNLHEEIAAMAKTDAITSSPIKPNSLNEGEVSPSNLTARSQDKPEKKRSREKLVQEFRISPLSEEMKRELRRDSKRYKENKAKLRRQKDLLLKRKSSALQLEVPVVRKLKKITEGLPSVSKLEDNVLNVNHTLTASTSFSSNFSDSFESKLSKLSAFASTSGTNATNSISSTITSTPKDTFLSVPRPNSLTASTLSSTTSLTQIIVNKLPSIGHKFLSDTKELIMKNANKPVETAISAVPAKPPAIQQKRTPHTTTAAKSSPKLHAKKKKTSDANESVDAHSSAAKKIKEKFRADISGDIVRNLKPYLSDTCEVGRIRTHDEFRHLARKLTFFVMLKELKYCNNVSLLEVTDSVKVKAREYIKKYMSKFGEFYIRGENEQDYRFEDL